LKNINYNPKIYYTFFSIFIFLEIFRHFSFLKNVNFYFVQSLAYLNIFLLILLTIKNYINVKSLNYSYYNISIIISILFFYLFLDFILGVIDSKNYGDYKYVFTAFFPWTMLMLAIFEAARSTDGIDTVDTAHAAILAKYEATVNAVDTLDGMDITEAYQVENIQKLSKEYEVARLRVLHMRDKVQALEQQTSEDVRVRLEAAGLERQEGQ
jgi:hypothetical protein